MNDNSFDLGSHVQIQLDLASEDPKTEEENIAKLNNQIKHVEFNIQQNRKRCENLSKNCYEILQSTELLAFDFLFANYLLGDMDSPPIYDFFDQCLHPSFDLSTGKESDFEKASEHISYLQDIIKKSSQSLLGNEQKKINIPKRTSEFILYLTDQKNRLDREMGRFKNPISTETENSNENEEEKNFKIEEEVPDMSGLPQTLKNWILSEFDFIQKEQENPNSNVETVNVVEKEPSPEREKEEQSEIHIIISSIAHRLAQIDQLSNHIQQLERIVVDPTSLDISSCDPRDIESSPFFIGLKNSCQLLHSAFYSMKIQSSFIPEYFNSLEFCRDQLLQLSTSLQNSIEGMQSQINKIRGSITSIQKSCQDLIEKLRPFINAIFMKSEFPSIEDSLDDYDLVKDNLEDDLKKLDDFDEMNPHDVMMSRQIIHKNIDMLEEIKNKKEQLGELFNKMTEIIKLIEEKDASILKLVMNYCKADEENELHKEEFRLLSPYEEGLKEVLKSLNFHDMGKWCQKLSEIVQSFYEASQEQQNIISKLQSMTTNSDIENEINQKKAEVETLSAQNGKLCEELEREKLKLDEVIQERSIAEEKMKDKIENNDWLPNYIDQSNEEMVNSYREMAICPICKQNRRDSILTTCGHPLCRSCLQKSGEKCPICSVPFAPANVKPFFLQ